MLAELAICVCALVAGADEKPAAEAPKENAQESKQDAKVEQKTEQKAEKKAQEPADKQANQKGDKKDSPKKLELIAIEKHIVKVTNAERARYGLPALEVDEELMESARDHCIWMAQNESLRHTQRPVAENIAMGQQDTEQAVGDWMRSPGHRANMLNGGFRRIGVAAYTTSRDVIFWCQQFRH